MIGSVAIIQARMGSERLPKKTMADVCGEPMLKRVVNQVRKANTVSQVVVATTDSEEDDSIAQFCVDENILFVRGNTQDVLSRL